MILYFILVIGSLLFIYSLIGIPFYAPSTLKKNTCKDTTGSIYAQNIFTRDIKRFNSKCEIPLGYKIFPMVFLPVPGMP